VIMEPSRFYHRTREVSEYRISTSQRAVSVIAVVQRNDFALRNEIVLAT
jgi:hypothetical protein